MESRQGACIYREAGGRYNWRVSYELTIGDVLRKARQKKRWSQTALGKKAIEFPLPGRVVPIGKNTVSKAENEPWSSELGTIWRLLAAVGLTFTDVEKVVHPWGEKTPAQAPPVTPAASARDRLIGTLADTAIREGRPKTAPPQIRHSRRKAKSR